MLFSQINTDEMFDLDSALTMPDPSSTEEENRQLTDAESTTAASAAEDLIDGMPTVAAGGGRCSVCMEGFRSGAEGKQIPCGHVFHSNCIAHWVSVHNSCPLCRSSVSTSRKFIF